ncbi:MAG: TolC family protein [Cyclobacteriaceae bacterium]
MYKSIVGLVLILASGWLQAQPLLTLEQAIGETLEKNFSIVVAKKNEQIAANNNDIGNAGFLPIVNAETTLTNSTNNTEQSFFDGREFNVPNASSRILNANLRLDWVLFDGFRMFATKERLGYLEAIGKTQTQLVIESTLVELITNYYDLSSNQNLLELYGEALAVSKSRRDLIQRRFDLGAGNRIELLQTIVNVNTDSSLYVQQANVVKRLKTVVNQYMNRDIKTDFKVESQISYNKNFLYEELLNMALMQNRELSEARLNVKVTNAAIKEAKSNYWPQLLIFSGLNYNQLENEAGFVQSSLSQGYNYGLNVRLNLFNGFNDRRQVQNERLNREALDNEVLDLELRISSNLYNAYNDFQTAITIAEFENDNLEIAQENLKIAVEQYSLGSINEVTFREIQQNVVQVSNRLYAAQFEIKLAEIELMQISGLIIGNSGI